MAGFTVLVCIGLNAYWVSRTLLLLRGSDEVIQATLESDAWLFRGLLAIFYRMLLPVTGSLGS